MGLWKSSIMKGETHLERLAQSAQGCPWTVPLPSAFHFMVLFEQAQAMSLSKCCVGDLCVSSNYTRKNTWGALN